MKIYKKATTLACGLMCIVGYSSLSKAATVTLPHYEFNNTISGAILNQMHTQGGQKLYQGTVSADDIGTMGDGYNEYKGWPLRVGPFKYSDIESESETRPENVPANEYYIQKKWETRAEILDKTTASSRQFSNDWGANANLDVSSKGATSFTGSAEFNFAKETKESGLSLSVYRTFKYEPYSLTMQWGEAGDGAPRFNDNAKEIWNQAAESGNYQKFENTYGDSYVEKMTRGAKLAVAATITFSNSSEMQKIGGKIEGEVKTALAQGKLTAEVTNEIQEQNFSGSITISAQQIGGDPTQLGSLLNLGEDGANYSATFSGAELLTNFNKFLNNLTAYTTYTDGGNSFPNQVNIDDKKTIPILAVEIRNYRNIGGLEDLKSYNEVVNQSEYYKEALNYIVHKINFIHWAEEQSSNFEKIQSLYPSSKYTTDLPNYLAALNQCELTARQTGVDICNDKAPTDSWLKEKIEDMNISIESTMAAQKFSVRDTPLLYESLLNHTLSFAYKNTSWTTPDPWIEDIMTYNPGSKSYNSSGATKLMSFVTGGSGNSTVWDIHLKTPSGAIQDTREESGPSMLWHSYAVVASPFKDAWGGRVGPCLWGNTGVATEDPRDMFNVEQYCTAGNDLIWFGGGDNHTEKETITYANTKGQKMTLEYFGATPSEFKSLPSGVSYKTGMVKLTLSGQQGCIIGQYRNNHIDNLFYAPDPEASSPDWNLIDGNINFATKDMITVNVPTYLTMYNYNALKAWSDLTSLRAV